MHTAIDQIGDYPGWREYRRLLLQRFGFAVTQEPVERWYAWRGHALHIDLYEPEGPARGTLVLVHGAGGHGRLLAPLGILATSLGWRAIAPDLPGYGVTRSPPGSRVSYAEWPECVAEIVRAQDGPVVTMGLSVGGMTALRAAQLAANTCGVIATTLVDFCNAAHFVEAARQRWLTRMSLGLMRHAPWAIDAMPFRLGWVTPLGAMSTEPGMRDWFRSDSLIGRRTVRGHFFRSLHQYRPEQAGLDLPCPLLLAHPGADEWTPLAMSEPTFEAVPGPKRLRVLTGGSHMPCEAEAWADLSEEVGTFLREAEGGPRPVG
jgi:pimeloyl-ACP methyl ester carboxylesterase